MVHYLYTDLPAITVCMIVQCSSIMTDPKAVEFYGLVVYNRLLERWVYDTTGPTLLCFCMHTRNLYCVYQMITLLIPEGIATSAQAFESSD